MISLVAVAAIAVALASNSAQHSHISPATAQLNAREHIRLRGVDRSSVAPTHATSRAPMHSTSRAPTPTVTRHTSATRTAMVSERAAAVSKPASTIAPATLVRVTSDRRIHARASVTSAVLGVMPAHSPYLATPTTAWVQKRSANGAWGLVQVPWKAGSKRGWMQISGFATRRSQWSIHVDLGAHRLQLLRDGKVSATFAAGTGAASSPTPIGKYYVSDIVPHPGGAFGSYAFGLSGTQWHPPAGWSGPAQLALHGTDNAATVGRSASAGCVHLSARALARLAQVVQLGTPVVISA